MTADPEVYENPEKFFDQIIEINLSELMPHINGPFSPDIATPVDQMSDRARENSWPLKVEWGLIDRVQTPLTKIYQGLLQLPNKQLIRG